MTFRKLLLALSHTSATEGLKVEFSGHGNEHVELQRTTIGVGAVPEVWGEWLVLVVTCVYQRQAETENVSQVLMALPPRPPLSLVVSLCLSVCLSLPQHAPHLLSCPIRRDVIPPQLHHQIPDEWTA
jgi:hypothetical protein